MASERGRRQKQRRERTDLLAVNRVAGDEVAGDEEVLLEVRKKRDGSRAVSGLARQTTESSERARLDSRRGARGRQKTHLALRDEDTLVTVGLEDDGRSALLGSEAGLSSAASTAASSAAGSTASTVAATSCEGGRKEEERSAELRQAGGRRRRRRQAGRGEESQICPPLAAPLLPRPRPTAEADSRLVRTTVREASTASSTSAATTSTVAAAEAATSAAATTAVTTAKAAAAAAASTTLAESHRVGLLKGGGKGKGVFKGGVLRKSRNGGSGDEAGRREGRGWVGRSGLRGGRAKDLDGRAAALGQARAGCSGRGLLPPKPCREKIARAPAWLAPPARRRAPSSAHFVAFSPPNPHSHPPPLLPSPINPPFLFKMVYKVADSQSLPFFGALPALRSDRFFLNSELTARRRRRSSLCSLARFVRKVRLRLATVPKAQLGLERRPLTGLRFLVALSLFCRKEIELAEREMPGPSFPLRRDPSAQNLCAGTVVLTHVFLRPLSQDSSSSVRRCVGLLPAGLRRERTSGAEC